MSSPVILITGALTGIGRAAARTFAQAGAHLVVSGRRDKEGQALAAELQELTQAVFGDVVEMIDVVGEIFRAHQRVGAIHRVHDDGSTGF